MNLLLISSITCILEFVAPILIKCIVMRLFCWKQYEKDLRNELVKLKQEMNNLSMVDEFAKYAKLQRQYNKEETALKQKVNEQSSSRTKIQLTLTYGFRVLNFLPKNTTINSEVYRDQSDKLSDSLKEKRLELKKKKKKRNNFPNNPIFPQSFCKNSVKSSVLMVCQLQGLFVFVLLYNHRHSPVILLPKGILWPIQSLLSWPTTHSDCISLPIWILINKLAISACKPKDM